MSTEQDRMALSAFAEGQPIILLHAQPILMVPAQMVTHEIVNMMAQAARGLVCHAMEQAQMEALELGLLPQRHLRAGAWVYGTSFEAAQGCSSGISAADRALTLRAGASAAPEAVVTPGHIMPVLASAEAEDWLRLAPNCALRALSLAGGAGGVAICQVLTEAGAVAGRAEAIALATRLALPMLRAECLDELAPILPAAFTQARGVSAFAAQS